MTKLTSSWIRIVTQDSKGNDVFGQAGRWGFIVPYSHAGAERYEGKTYNGLDKFYASTAKELKALLDGK